MKKILLIISLLALGQSFAYNRITIMNETDNYDINGYLYANSSACNAEKNSFFEIYSYENQTFTPSRFFSLGESYNGITYTSISALNNAFLTGELSFTKINFKISSNIGYLEGIGYGDAIRIPNVHNNCNLDLPSSFTNNVIHEGSFTIGSQIYFTVIEL